MYFHTHSSSSYVIEHIVIFNRFSIDFCRCLDIFVQSKNPSLNMPDYPKMFRRSHASIDIFYV
ncbi:hypothetical protein LguiA_012105 [Lonicera macranthoides]